MVVAMMHPKGGDEGAGRGNKLKPPVLSGFPIVRRYPEWLC